VPAAITGQAALKFKVDRVLVEFKPEDRPVQNILITNTSGEVLDMSARVRAVESPGLPAEREVETDAMLVSPLFFRLEPGASRQVRLVGVEEPEEAEQVFRVALAPRRSEHDPRAKVRINGKEAELSVVTAFAVTVLRAPEGATAALRSSRAGEDVVLSNEGNRSIALTEVRVCRRSERSSCEEQPVRRLYPGAEWRVRVPAAGRLELLQRIGKDFQTVVIEGSAE